MEADTLEASDETKVNLLSIRVDDRNYGIPINQVQEVVISKKVTMMPLAPDHVSGLISLRGQVIVLFNLRKILQISKKAQDNMTIIVNINGVFGAVEVSEVMEIVSLDREVIEDTPETMSSGAKKYITGICNLDSKFMVVLDLHEILNV